MNTITNTANNNSTTSFGKTTNQQLDANIIDNFSFTDIMSAASQFTDNAFSFSESSTYTVACSTPKKRKMSARYEDEIVNQDGDHEQLTVSTSCKKVKMETYTAANSPTKRKLPIFKLSENKTREINVDPMSADTSSMSALGGNMFDCFNQISSIVSDLNSDDFFSSSTPASVSSFTKEDLAQALSLLNQ